jgi:hypothetical protein
LRFWKIKRVWKATRAWKITRSIENYKTMNSLEYHRVRKSPRGRLADHKSQEAEEYPLTILPSSLLQEE